MPSAYMLCLAIYLLLFGNSLPFAWTVRVFAAAWRIRLTQRLRTKSSAAPIGCHGPSASTAQPGTPPLSAENCDPFTDVITWHHRATLDDCDFMGHLSNSSYPKNLDVARIYYAANRLGQFMADGGWTPLASTSFTFHKEIPVGSRYRVEMRIETWTDKWIFIRNEFRGGKDTLFCTAITKHCFKYGRKTVAPWFVLAYCGYSDGTSASPTHADTSRSMRAGLGRKKNPLKAYETPKQVEAKQDGEVLWWQPSAWHGVAAWEPERQRRLQVLRASFFESE